MYWLPYYHQQLHVIVNSALSTYSHNRFLVRIQEITHKHSLGAHCVGVSKYTARG